MKRTNLHLREFKSYVFAVSRHPIPFKFRLFAEAKVLPRLHLKGYKRAKKQELAICLLHSLVVAYKRGACLADVADTGEAGVRMRVELWNAILAAKLAIKCTGSESAKVLTRYYATKKLLALRKKWHLEVLVDVELQHNTDLDRATPHGLVYLHTGRIDLVTGKPLPAKDRKQAIDFKHLCSDLGIEMLRSIEDTVEAFNDNNLRHSWKFYVTDPDTGRQRSSPLNPCLRQIHVGQFFRAVRFYSWSELSGQNLSKEERKTILIDGEHVAELDFSASVIRMMYHLRGLDPQGDLYRPERIFRESYADASIDEQHTLRKFVKQVTLICLNVKSRAAARSSVGKLLKEHEDRETLWAAIRGLEGTDIKGIVRRVAGAHKDKADKWYLRNNGKAKSQYGIADQFFSGIGLQMMTEESKVMKRLLTAFTKAEEPALMIHDAVVCKVSVVKFAKKAMTKAYQQLSTTDFLPVIKRSF
jgi:hypothetical protein